MKRFVFVVFFLALSTGLGGQTVAVSTNLASYADYGTLNAELSYALAQHWSVTAGVKYNPFTFSGGDWGIRQNRQRAAAVGFRFWPWHTYSGIWTALKAQYQEYNRGGIESEVTSEGDRMGAALSAGYSYMLGTHFNIEAGAGVWAGQDRFVKYACPTCGRTVDSGNKRFVMLNDVLLSLSYIF